MSRAIEFKPAIVRLFMNSLIICACAVAFSQQPPPARIYAHTVQGDPVRGLKVCYEDICSPETNDAGRSEILLPQSKKAFDRIHFEVREPVGYSALRVTDVVPNGDDPRSFVEVLCIRKGDSRVLSDPIVVRELKNRVNR